MKKVYNVAIMSCLLWTAYSYENHLYQNENGIYAVGGDFISTILTAGVMHHIQAHQDEQAVSVDNMMQSEPHCTSFALSQSEHVQLYIQSQKNTRPCGMTAAPIEGPWEFIDAAQKVAYLEKYKDIFLKNCTVEEFKRYIAECEIKNTQQLVSHTEWWPYDVFWEYVESLSDGHSAVVLFKESYLQNNSNLIIRGLHLCTGKYKKGSYDLVQKQYARHEECYNRKEQEKEWQRQCAQQQYEIEQIQKAEQEQQQCYAQQQYAVEQIQKVQHVQHKIIEEQHHADLCTMANIVREWQESDDQQLQERFAAFTQQDDTFQEHRFAINKIQQQFLRNHQLNSDQWGSIYGSMLQKQLHTELLACIDDGIALHDDRLFVETVDLAHQTNRAGLVAKSSLLLDLCKAVIKGVARGSVQGLRNTVYTKLHPIDATINTIKAVGSIAHCCAQAGSSAAKLIYYYATDEQKYYTTMRDISDYNAAVCGLISDYFSKNDLPSIVHDATYLIAETVVSGRSMRLINGWGSRLTQKLANYAQQCVTESPLVVVGLPGLKIKDAKIENAHFFDRHRHSQKGGSSPSKSKSDGSRRQSVAQEVKKILKAKNGDDFLDNTEFGKWLNNYCKGTGRKYKGEQVYRVTGEINHPYLQEDDFFYLDSLHKNHLEVFRKFEGKIRQRYVIDLNGTINRKLTDKVIAEGRVSRW